jgi:ubiquinone/menaquinone biosynthesis C-methylase UbiE
MRNLEGKILSIDRLSFKIETQLHRVGDFYICSHFTEEFIGPPLSMIENSIYYRFMKFIYLPQPPEYLKPEQVIEVCDLRLDYLDKLIDYELNKRIVSTIIEKATHSFNNNADSPVKVLDFGCGSGLSSQLILEHMPNLGVVGVDISKKAILQSHQQGLITFLSHYREPLPFKDESFDAITAVFVMHFNIEVSTLAELRRVLRPSGNFVFNLLKRDTHNFDRRLFNRDIWSIIQQLREAGFCSIKIWNNPPGIDTNHIIVSCEVFPSCETAFHTSRLKPIIVSGK